MAAELAKAQEALDALAQYVCGYRCRREDDLEPRLTAAEERASAECFLQLLLEAERAVEPHRRMLLSLGDDAFAWGCTMNLGAAAEAPAPAAALGWYAAATWAYDGATKDTAAAAAAAAEQDDSGGGSSFIDRILAAPLGAGDGPYRPSLANIVDFGSELEAMLE